MTESPRSTATAGPRLIGLDVVRGIALLAMAIYHLGWDLEFFGYLAPGTTGQGAWKLFARAIATSFLFLAGFSLVLGHHPTIRWRSFGRRFVMIAVAAGLITLATYFAMPDRFIFFGILHAIAAASLMGLLFLRVPPILTLAIGCLAVVAPIYFRSSSFDAPVFWWVGLSSQDPLSNDYVPVLPWLGPALIGIAAARVMKARGLLTIFGYDRQPTRAERALAFGGRHSLAIYLVHQPLLIGLVYLLAQVAPPPPVDPAVSYGRSCQAGCEAQQSVEFCSRYCACTYDKLIEQSLIDDLIQRRIDPASDPAARAIADQCVAEIFEGQPQ